ncbi:MAG: hypothetical protein ACKOGG_05945 [Actinomycetota bacterium]
MTPPTLQDIARVTELLGRKPQGDFEVALRGSDGDIIVVKNAPLLFDGTPMPTRYWLVGVKENVAVSRLDQMLQRPRKNASTVDDRQQLVFRAGESRATACSKQNRGCSLSIFLRGDHCQREYLGRF